MIQLCIRYLLVWSRPPVLSRVNPSIRFFIKHNFIESMSPTHILLNLFFYRFVESMYVSSPGRVECSLNNAATNLMQVLILKLGCLQTAKGVPKTNKSLHWTLNIRDFHLISVTVFDFLHRFWLTFRSHPTSPL